MTINHLLDEKQVANLLGLSVQTLRNDRAGRRRIPYVKMGKAVRYRPEDVQAFIEGNRILGETGR